MQSSNEARFLMVFMLTLLSATNSKHPKCDHADMETEFPPETFNQVLDESYIDNFDEVFVIGDVHGCLEELKLLLNKSNTEGTNVLKILTGDITRKGPDSVGVVRFVRDTPSMMTVRGNNDQKVLKTYLKKQKQPDYEYNESYKFIENMTIEDLFYLTQLPYTISIPSLNAIIVHGGVQPGKSLQDNKPYDLMNLRNLIEDEYCPGGYRPFNGENKGTRWAPLYDGPEFIYFGHDHPRNMQITPRAIGIDTSCVYGSYLTGIFIKGPRKNKLVQQKALNAYFSH